MPKRTVGTICFAALLFAMMVLVFTPAASAQMYTVRFGPPPLPYYDQPQIPGDGYIWSPGYWSWDDDYDDYYWVPGTWVEPPEQGLLWTPGYWGWNGDGYSYNEGYWAPQVGWYGGVNYGYGYNGEGYYGGRWENGRFYYNRSCNNLNPSVVRYVYVSPVREDRENRISYNGGQGGISRRPRPEDERAEHERHIPPAPAQRQQVQLARANPQLRASENRGKPPVAATAKPGDFRDNAVAAKQAGGNYNPPPNRGAAARNNGADNNRNADRSNNNADRNAGSNKADPNNNQPAGNMDRNPDRPANNADRNPERPANNDRNPDRPANNAERNPDRPANNVDRNPDRPANNAERNPDRPAGNVDRTPDHPANVDRNPDRGNEPVAHPQGNDNREQQKMEQRDNHERMKPEPPHPTAQPQRTAPQPDKAARPDHPDHPDNKPNAPAPKDDQPH